MGTNASLVSAAFPSPSLPPLRARHPTPRWPVASTVASVPRDGTAPNTGTNNGPPQPAPPLVVIVEDDNLVRLAISAFLTELGCEVLAVASAEAAAATFLSLARQPDLIFCDYCLPHGANGLQVIATARTCFGNDVPAYLVTGTVSDDLLTRSVAANVPVIYKPVSPLALQTIVERSRD